MENGRMCAFVETSYGHFHDDDMGLFAKSQDMTVTLSWLPLPLPFPPPLAIPLRPGSHVLIELFA